MTAFHDTASSGRRSTTRPAEGSGPAHPKAPEPPRIIQGNVTRRSGGAPAPGGGPIRLPARPAPPMDGAGGGLRPDRGSVRAGDVAPELGAVLPGQEPALVGQGAAGPPPPELVGGAAPRRQRDPPGGPALRLDPNRGARGPGPLRPLH